MIVSIRGVLEAAGPDWVHVQVGGVTLQAFVPASSIGELGAIGGQVSLHTHLRIQNEQPVLYGFPTSASLDLFVLLNGVSGVGPRMSLALLSTLGVAGVHQAISSDDIAALSAAPGVGRRTSGRILLELKGKLPAVDAATVATHSASDSEVVEALTALGYSSSEARQAVSNLEKGAQQTVEDRIRLALQQFGVAG